MENDHVDYKEIYADYHKAYWNLHADVQYYKTWRGILFLIGNRLGLWKIPIWLAQYRIGIKHND